MSTSLLYHTCGDRGYEYRSTEYICGTTMVHIEQPREKLRCPHCGRGKVSIRGRVSRVFRSVPIGSKPVSIILDVARVLLEVQCDPTGAGRLCGRISPAHAGLCPVRPGVDEDGDDPGRGRPSARRVGLDQGVEEKATCGRTLSDGEAPQSEAPRDRRNLHRSWPAFPDAGARSGYGSHRLRRAGNGPTP